MDSSVVVVTDHLNYVTRLKTQKLEPELVFACLPEINAKKSGKLSKLIMCKLYTSSRRIQIFVFLPARQLCCEQVLFFVASVCVSVRTKSRKLLIRNWCNLVGVCPMVNARSGWKLVTFDLELFSYFFHLPCISHLPLGVSNALTHQLHFQNI